MSRPMLIRSITLSIQSFEAWKSIGGWFPKRERTMREALDLYARRDEDDSPIINLGDGGFQPTPEDLDIRSIDRAKVFNHGADLSPLWSPGSIRNVFNDLIPPYPAQSGEGSYWIKAPGAGGRGKTRVTDQPLPEIPSNWDLQEHVEGQEYRLITVDDVVVQGFERFGENGDRRYNWVGVRNCPSPIKTMAKDAASRMSGRNVLAWDLILNEQGQPFLFEGNSCPGMSTQTATRIINYIDGRTYEDA